MDSRAVREAFLAEVEDAALDAYDLAFDQAVRGAPGARQQQLVAIQDAFLCCGKSSPFGLLGGAEVSLCPGEAAARQDCLVGIRSFLRTYGHITSTLTGIGLASMVYAMVLSSFLWFAIRSGCSLDRRGKYTLSRRACGCRPQEPSFFRRSQGGPRSGARPKRTFSMAAWVPGSERALGGTLGSSGTGRHCFNHLSGHLSAHRG